MRIGSHVLAAPLALAPMAGVTDRPFRVLCRRFGAGLAATEMLTSDPRLWRSRKSGRRSDLEGEPEPRVVQIAGTEPEAMAAAARRCVERGAQIIDLNMGCPVRKVCSRAAGSALLRDEVLVRRILERVVREAGVPVTLKMRTGWDRASRNAPSIARLAEDAGVAALAVHGRTRADFFNGSAEYDTIAAVVDTVRIPVFANGDIDSPEKALQVLAGTGAAGVMIGRAALGRPWIFREIRSYLATGVAVRPPTATEVRDIMLAHLESLHAFHGEDAGVRIARKHLGWYVRQLPARPVPPAALLRASRASDQLEQAAAFLAAAA